MFFYVIMCVSLVSAWRPDDNGFFKCLHEIDATCEDQLKDTMSPASRVRATNVTLQLPRTNSPDDLSDSETAIALGMLSQFGVVVLTNAVPCAMLVEVARDTEARFPITRPGDQLREDTPQHDGVSVLTLRRLLNRLAKLIDEAVGPTAEIVEFSVMSTFPGSLFQRVHADTRMYEETHRHRAPQYSLFVACQDTNKKMGPLTVWPRTHDSFHFADVIFASEYLQIVPGVAVGAVECGSVVMFDSRLFHHGGENASDRMRHMMYVTVEGPGEKPKDQDMRPYSLHPSMKGVTTADVREYNYPRDL